jgi:hypothetical protein
LILLGFIFLRLASGRPPSPRLRALIFAVLAGALLSYPNFGFFHRGYGPIHYWDAFHYFMGAKYFPEIGYFGLYEATVVAGRELGAFGAITTVRDLTSYAVRPVDSIDARAVRARFSRERWLGFKRDLLFLGPHIDQWHLLLLDHGYNDPPPRALLLHLLVGRLPASSLTLALLTSLDYLVLIAALGLVWRAFGVIPAALASAFFFLNFFARFDFIGGSILRWDWVAALLIGVAALARGSGGTAGVFLGYAVLARLFPALFLVPLGLKWLQTRLAGKRDAPVGRCLGAATALVVVVTAGFAAAGEERSFLREFISKIHLHSEGLSANSIGLGSLIALTTAPLTAFADGSLYVAEAATLAARPAPSVLRLVAAAYLLVALPLIRRARPLESLLYAVPLVFCALSPSGYYYSFLVLLVLLPWQGGPPDRARLVEMALLAFTMAGSYAFELHSSHYFPLFYYASILLGLFFLVWLSIEYARFGARGGESVGGDPALHSTSTRPEAPSPPAPAAADVDRDGRSGVQ